MYSLTKKEKPKQKFSLLTKTEIYIKLYPIQYYTARTGHNSALYNKEILKETAQKKQNAKRN